MGRRAGRTLAGGSEEVTMVAAPVRSLAVLAAALAAFLIAAPAGNAIPACTFDAGSGVVQALIDAGAPLSRFSVGAGGAILADGVACGAATVTTADTVKIERFPGTVGRPQLSIDLSAGALAPGRTDEAGASDEIEWEITLLDTALPTLTIVGGAGPEHVVAGDLGMNLNAAEAPDDVDVAFVITGDLGDSILDRMIGNGGNDILSNAGGEGTGGPWEFSTPLLDGGPGADTLRAGIEDALMLGRGQNDLLVGGPDDFDDLRGGPGIDTLQGMKGDDTLDGGPGDDTLLGGENDDTITGGLGADLLSGGFGLDSLFADDNVVDRVIGGPNFDTANVDLLNDGSPVQDLVSTVESVT
jgi:Ca2+-binding RTX toxin-like protein